MASIWHRKRKQAFQTTRPDKRKPARTVGGTTQRKDESGKALTDALRSIQRLDASPVSEKTVRSTTQVSRA
jgi:hypothetical protein